MRDKRVRLAVVQWQTTPTKLLTVTELGVGCWQACALRYMVAGPIHLESAGAPESWSSTPAGCTGNADCPPSSAKEVLNKVDMRTFASNMADVGTVRLLILCTAQGRAEQLLQLQKITFISQQSRFSKWYAFRRSGLLKTAATQSLD